MVLIEDLKKGQSSVLVMYVDDNANEIGEDSFFRILFHDHIKYITVAPHTYDNETLNFPMTLVAQFPKLPLDEPDTWTRAYISRDPSSGALQARVSSQPLLGVTTLWHPTYIDIFALRDPEYIKVDVSAATLDGRRVIAKYCPYEWYMLSMERETIIYKLLEGHNIAPAFLGHLTEHGRVVGFVLEKKENVRHAGIEDLEQCQDTLGRLHSLGILHGDMHRGNFLVSPDGSVVLIDFETAQWGATQEQMDQEFGVIADMLVKESNV